MKTPEEVRKYEEEKRRKFEQELRIAELKKREIREDYLKLLRYDLNEILDDALDEGEVTQNGGTINIEEIMNHVKGTFPYSPDDIVRDTIDYFKQNKWNATYSIEDKVYSGPEPAITRAGHFIHFKPAEQNFPG